MAHYSGCEVCQMLAFTSTLACVTCYNNTCLGRPITDPNELNFNNVLSTSERFFVHEISSSALIMIALSILAILHELWACFKLHKLQADQKRLLCRIAVS